MNRLERDLSSWSVGKSGGLQQLRRNRGIYVCSRIIILERWSCVRIPKRSVEIAPKLVS